MAETSVRATPAIGVYVTAIGGALLTAGSGWALRRVVNENEDRPQG